MNDEYIPDERSKDKMIASFALGVSEQLQFRDQGSLRRQTPFGSRGSQPDPFVFGLERLAGEWGYRLKPFLGSLKPLVKGGTLRFNPEAYSYWWDTLIVLGSEIAGDEEFEESSLSLDEDKYCERFACGASFALGYLVDRVHLVSLASVSGLQSFCADLGISRSDVRYLWKLIGDRLLDVYDAEESKSPSWDRAGHGTAPKLRLVTDSGSVRFRGATTRRSGSFISRPELRELLAAGVLEIDPIPPIDVNNPDPCIDLLLGSEATVWPVAMPMTGTSGQNFANGSFPQSVTLSSTEPYLLYPGQSMNAYLQHSFRLPPNIMGQLHGRHEYAAKHLSVELAPWFKVGWSGRGLLELRHTGFEPIPLTVGTRICQMLFQWV